LLFSDPEAAKQKINEAFAGNATSLLDPSSAKPTVASTIVHLVVNEKFELVGRKFAVDEIAARCADAVINDWQLAE
jgi:hypothetical protein